jgi:hypothetical protein
MSVETNHSDASSQKDGGCRQGLTGRRRGNLPASTISVRNKLFDSVKEGNGEY